eukprot:Nk52_evm29s2152 gene=Nk52_evmTU29s2152
MNQFKVLALVAIAAILLTQVSAFVMEREEYDFTSFDVNGVDGAGSGSGSKARRSIEDDFDMESTSGSGEKARRSVEEDFDMDSASGSGAYKARRSVEDFDDFEDSEFELASGSGDAKVRRSVDDLASGSGAPQAVTIPASAAPSPTASAPTH